MKHFIFMLTLIVMLTLTGFERGIPNAIGHKGSPARDGLQEDTSVITIKVTEPSVVKNRLTFRWEIKNSTTEPVYVYSTLLEHNDIAEIITNAETHVIKVLFLRLEPSRILPYSFPKATFLKLLPGQVIQGRFLSNERLRHVRPATSPNKSKNQAAISHGQWSVQAFIAFGKEVASVQRTLERLKADGIQEHPINPIVEWQEVASSAPVVLRM